MTGGCSEHTTTGSIQDWGPGWGRGSPLTAGSPLFLTDVTFTFFLMFKVTPIHRARWRFRVIRCSGEVVSGGGGALGGWEPWKVREQVCWSSCSPPAFPTPRCHGLQGRATHPLFSTEDSKPSPEFLQMTSVLQDRLPASASHQLPQHPAQPRSARLPPPWAPQACATRGFPAFIHRHR